MSFIVERPVLQHLIPKVFLACKYKSIKSYKVNIKLEL